MTREHAYHLAQGSSWGLARGPGALSRPLSARRPGDSKRQRAGLRNKIKAKREITIRKNRTGAQRSARTSREGHNSPELARRKGLAQLPTPFREEAGAGGRPTCWPLQSQVKSLAVIATAERHGRRNG